MLVRRFIQAHYLRLAVQMWLPSVTWNVSDVNGVVNHRSTRTFVALSVTRTRLGEDRLREGWTKEKGCIYSWAC